MSRFTDYAQYIGTAPFSWKHELLSEDGELLATSIESESGNGVKSWAPVSQDVSFDRGGVSASTSSVSLPITDSSFIPKSRGSILHPDAKSKVRISAGLTIEGVETYWTQGTLLVDEPTASAGPGPAVMGIELLDATSPTRVELKSSFLFDDGDTVESVVSRLLALVLPSSSFSVTPTGFVMPGGAFQVGDEIVTLLGELLGGCGHEMTANPDGRLITRAVPDSIDTGALERWRYGQSDGIPIEGIRRSWRKREPQGLIVEGGSVANSDPVVVRTVFDTDPSSLGYFAGGSDVSLPTKNFPWLLTIPQADAAGYAELRRIGNGPGVVEFTTAPNPAMRPYDFIELERDDLDATGSYQVVGYSLPVKPNGLMTVRARRTWNPEIRFRGSIDENAGFETAIADDFDRDDEDLQGSNWTEHEWSWAVVGQQAVQRYNNGWSMAIWNKPLAYSNQLAQATATRVPADRFVGPVIRSGGGFDGYAALIGSNGVVTLESWVGGKLDARLGSYDSGLSPVGRVLVVKGLGTTITVQLDGATVISVSDDKHLGTHVGMLGLGAPEATAPALDDFSAAQAS